MKKISIILSAALLAATFALAGCSNVTELNGSEWDTYKANASGQTLAAANHAAGTKVNIITTTQFYDFTLSGSPDDVIPASVSVVVKSTIDATAADVVITLSESTAGALYELKVAKGTVILGDTYTKVELKRKDTASDKKFKDFSANPSFSVS